MDVDTNDERSLFKELFEKDKTLSLQPGQTWYVLNTPWFNQWKEHVNFIESPTHTAAPKPGKINNKHLIQKILKTEDIPELFSVAMKEDLSEPDDYVVISETVRVILMYLQIGLEKLFQLVRLRTTSYYSTCRM
jgi:hypothetical protein